MVFPEYPQAPCYSSGIVIAKDMPVMLPKERIDAWISPTSNPDEIVPYALTDMIIEKQGLL